MSKLQDVDRCVKCGHRSAPLLATGLCASFVKGARCPCKCEFPSPSVSEAEDKNSGEPKPKAPSHSSVVIPESVSLDADEPWRVLDLCQRALRSLPIDALGRDPQEGWFYRDELLSHVERVLRAIPITQDGASASALSTTAPAHGQASFIDSKSSESELVTVDEVSKALEELREMFPNTWVFVADRATWTQGCESPTRSAVIEIERKENAFFGTTLSEAMKRVKVSKEQQK